MLHLQQGHVLTFEQDRFNTTVTHVSAHEQICIYKQQSSMSVCVGRVAYRLKYWEVRANDHAQARTPANSPWLRERTLDDAGMLLMLLLLLHQLLSSLHRCCSQV